MVKTAKTWHCEMTDRIWRHVMSYFSIHNVDTTSYIYLCAYIYIQNIIYIKSWICVYTSLYIYISRIICPFHSYVLLIMIPFAQGSSYDPHLHYGGRRHRNSPLGCAWRYDGIGYCFNGLVVKKTRKIFRKAMAIAPFFVHGTWNIYGFPLKICSTMLNHAVREPNVRRGYEEAQEPDDCCELGPCFCVSCNWDDHM